MIWSGGIKPRSKIPCYTPGSCLHKWISWSYSWSFIFIIIIIIIFLIIAATATITTTATSNYFSSSYLSVFFFSSFLHLSIFAFSPFFSLPSPSPSSISSSPFLYLRNIYVRHFLCCRTSWGMQARRSPWENERDPEVLYWSFFDGQASQQRTPVLKFRWKEKMKRVLSTTPSTLDMW